MTTAPDIFLSYNREDQARAKLFAEAFDAQGFKVWWDVGLRTGEAYDQVTETALRTAKAVVVLWSKKSVQSRWVRAEATLADRNKTLVPCMIEPCERPIMFELTQTAELSHWKGDAADKAWRAFLADVQRFVAKEAPAVEAPAAPLAAPTVQETLKPGQSGSAPSLAVLPFTNRSGLPEDEVFAEGMVEDVISALSQGVNVRVLGAMATAHLRKGAITDLSAIGRQLGVRYLLEGNVRRVGVNLRVTTQLLAAATGAVIWTAKFDRPLTELAELQEELVTDIAASLDTQVYAIEMAQALKKPGDITAWEAVARGYSAWSKHDPQALQCVIEEGQRAISITPDYAPGHAMLAVGLADSYLVYSPYDPAEVRRIKAVAERALALAPHDPSVLAHVGQSLGFVGFPEEGGRHTARAVEKAPANGMVHYRHGLVCVMLNRSDEALSHLKTAERLMPGWHVMWSLKVWQAFAYCALERWADADAAAEESIALVPSFGILHALKALICWQLERTAEARSHIELASLSGWNLIQTERLYRRGLPNSPRLEDDIAILRALYAEMQS
jgi:TolB-like protein